MTPTWNVYAATVLVTVLVAYALDTVATTLDLRRLSRPAPERLAKVFDPARLLRVRDYAAARARLAMVARSLSTFLFLGFWWLGGFGRLYEIVWALPLSPVLLGAVYAALLGLAAAVFGVPFDLVSTFVIEERFGFNRTTLRTWVLDRLKGGALALVLGGPLLLGVIWLFTKLGGAAWWWVWLGTTVFSLGLQLVVPTWILPLFHRLEPLADGALRQALVGYADRVGFPLRDVFVVDGSRRTAKANAFFIGLGRNRRVALYDTLIEKHEERELLAVLAHEVGHFKRRHIPLFFVLGVLHTGALLFVLSFFLERPALFAAFGVPEPSVGVGLVLFGLLVQPIDLLLGIAFSWLSRRNEYEADRFAAETTAQPEALASALEKLSADSLSHPYPSRLSVVLGSSHPPLLDRLRALDSWRLSKLADVP